MVFLLLLSMLLYTWPGAEAVQCEYDTLFKKLTSVKAEQLFTIRSVTVVIEPSSAVERGTNVTIRCQAVVSSQEPHLNRRYQIHKDGTVVYSKSTSSSEDLLYPLPLARVSNTGKYRCQVAIERKKQSSSIEKLSVTGLSKPELHLNKGVFSEGEEVNARCEAPGETGSIIFFFYKNSKEIQEERVATSYVETRLRFNDPGIHKLTCSYTVLIMPDSIQSNTSNTVLVSVKELLIQPVLKISSEWKIFEGDHVNISCSITGHHSNLNTTKVYLSTGLRLLASGNTHASHGLNVLAVDSGEIECRLEMGDVVKLVTRNLTVTELFSAPTLSMDPAEVFPSDVLRFVCTSLNYSSERVRAKDVRYTIRTHNKLSPQDMGEGVYVVHTSSKDFNYTCQAEAKGVTKSSNTLQVKPKVPVSSPDVFTEGRVILGHPFQVGCVSTRGSWPINYTLLREDQVINSSTVRQPQRQALFPLTIHRAQDMELYRCGAQNGRFALRGLQLNTTVTEPLSEPGLSVLPDLDSITEGSELYLICSIRGSPPVTFKWYRGGSTQPLFTTTSQAVTEAHRLPAVSSQQSGLYYCEALNYANSVRSQEVTIQVRMAKWKKALVGASCLLLLALLLLLLLLRFKAKRVRVDGAATSVWSERPPDTGSDDERSVTTNEPDVEYTEVVHPQPVDFTKVPLKKGTDTVYSELQTSPHGPGDDHDYVSP
ncbi:platelet endothelial cell adhesion molecule [Aplochiton taeniatus]